MTTCFSFLSNISRLRVVYPLGRQKERNASFFSAWANLKVCGGGGVIQTRVMATDGQLLSSSYYYHHLPYLPKRFSPVSGLPYLVGRFSWFCFFVFTGTIPIWSSKWRLSSDPITITARLDGPRHLSLRLFFYFWP